MPTPKAKRAPEHDADLDATTKIPLVKQQMHVLSIHVESFEFRGVKGGMATVLRGVMLGYYGPNAVRIRRENVMPLAEEAAGLCVAQYPWWTAQQCAIALLNALFTQLVCAITNPELYGTGKRPEGLESMFVLTRFVGEPNTHDIVAEGPWVPQVLVVRKRPADAVPAEKAVPHA